MAKEEKSTVIIDDFSGIITNLDSKDLRQGAADVQVNLCCLKPGEIQARQGYRVVSFDSED